MGIRKRKADNEGIQEMHLTSRYAGDIEHYTICISIQSPAISGYLCIH